MRWVWALTDVAGEHYLTYAREVAHDGGGLPAVHLHLPDELGVLRQVSETAVAADVVRQFPAEVIGQEPLGESGEELVSQGGEAALGGEFVCRAANVCRGRPIEAGRALPQQVSKGLDGRQLRHLSEVRPAAGFEQAVIERVTETADHIEDVRGAGDLNAGVCQGVGEIRLAGGEDNVGKEQGGGGQSAVALGDFKAL
jgi:hypothetical protein